MNFTTKKNSIICETKKNPSFLHSSISLIFTYVESNIDESNIQILQERMENYIEDYLSQKDSLNLYVFVDWYNVVKMDTTKYHLLLDTYFILQWESSLDSICHSNHLTSIIKHALIENKRKWIHYLKTGNTSLVFTNYFEHLNNVEEVLILSEDDSFFLSPLIFWSIVGLICVLMILLRYFLSQYHQ